MSIFRWIEYSTDSRKQYIVELMKCIRLGLLDTQFFLERVKDHPYVASCEASRPMIIETLKFLYDLEMITHRYFVSMGLFLHSHRGVVLKLIYFLFWGK